MSSTVGIGNRDRCDGVTYEGIGKPEPLKYGLAGGWSRRITDEHRLVYRLVDDNLGVLQTRYHY
jgi:toxin YoeB